MLETTTKPSEARGALFVAAGILLSRVAGLIRLRAFAHYFGLQSDAADAFNAAFRIPNLLQNLFGEGALSASFIPVYASLVGRGDSREADRVAGAVGALLALTTAVLVATGVAGAPALTAVIAPGFSDAKRELTILIVRVLFPGAGLLVLSAWCLGVLNSHRRFLLSYAAPVMWNAAMIATLVIFGASTPLPRLAVWLAWGSVAGSALQFAVQLPAVLRVAPGLRFAIDRTSVHVRQVARNFVPVFVGRGVVQISAFVDTLIASLLPTGAVTGLANAQLLYTLPVSLFGMSVAAAELPAMAVAGGRDASARDALRQRLQDGLRRIAFFVVPSAIAFLAFGDVIAAALLQTGRFRSEDAVYVWGILAGSALGLLASTLGRLYSSAYYALHDTRTPLAFAIVRIFLSTILGYFLAVHAPVALGVSRLWGAAGLTVSASAAGWIELLLLRRSLNARIGVTGLPLAYVVTLWFLGLAAAAAGWAVRTVLPPLHPAVAAAAILGPFGALYLGGTLWRSIPEATSLVRRFRPRRQRR
jgi:putative peptidoglycan lipid II flippase